MLDISNSTVSERKKPVIGIVLTTGDIPLRSLRNSLSKTVTILQFLFYSIEDQRQDDILLLLFLTTLWFGYFLFSRLMDSFRNYPMIT